VRKFRHVHSGKSCGVIRVVVQNVVLGFLHIAEAKFAVGALMDDLVEGHDSS
jgi:hypothetical protein